MSYTADNLYNLLPAIYRMRDGGQGGSIKELLQVIAEQMAILEGNLEQLYDDQFIETCSEWAIPYIGELIEYQPLHQVTTDTFNRRAEVANTINYRRRKGTVSMLEQMAQDVTGWYAHVVEFSQLVAATQHMNHLKMDNLLSDIRDANSLEKLKMPFEVMTHTVDVRSVTNGAGRYNISNIGLFLWHIKPHSLTKSPVFMLENDEKDEEDGIFVRCCMFHPLGIDTQLFINPKSSDKSTSPEKLLNYPGPITRKILKENFDSLYGFEKSLSIMVDGNIIEKDDIAICDLSNIDTWENAPVDKFTIDPELGRISLPLPDQSNILYVNSDVRVNFHYGFYMDIGGGEYERRKSFYEFDSDYVLKKVSNNYTDNVSQLSGFNSTIESAIDKLSDNYVIELDNNNWYKEKQILTSEGQILEIRAANGIRANINAGKSKSNESEFEIDGADESEIILNGLLISGGTVKVKGNMKLLRLNHCTLTSNLLIESTNTSVIIDHCILLGELRTTESTKVWISDSILDHNSENCFNDNFVYAGNDGKSAGGILHIENTTVLGRVHTKKLAYACNTIFYSAVNVQSYQKECVKYSYIPNYPENNSDINSIYTSNQDSPKFSSLCYGNPHYCRLDKDCPILIKQGADDEGEMGVFHDLLEPQREINLRARLNEYLRFGIEAGIFYDY